MKNNTKLLIQNFCAQNVGCINSTERKNDRFSSTKEKVLVS